MLFKKFAVLAVALVAAAVIFNPGSPRSAAAANDAWTHAADDVQDLAEVRIESEFAKIEGDSAKSRRISALLDSAVERISDGEAKEARKVLARVAERRKEILEELAEARMDQAIKKSSGLQGILEGLMGVSPEAKIAKLEAEQKDLDGEEKQARVQLETSLQAAGVQLTPSQIDGLLMLATGDKLVDMMAAFANLKSIEEELRRVVEASGESATSARRYYGLHATLAEAALYMQQQFIADIDTRYLPELQRIEDEARALTKEAKALKKAGSQDADVIDANIAAQELTLKTAGIYRQELERQRAAMKSAAGKTSRDVAVAVNTWRTVKVTTDLVAMIRSADGDFKGLLALQLPDLKPFGGTELKAEFERITVRLNSAPGS